LGPYRGVPEVLSQAGVVPECETKSGILATFEGSAGLVETGDPSSVACRFILLLPP
jgi:hypothetical protein